MSIKIKVDGADVDIITYIQNGTYGSRKPIGTSSGFPNGDDPKDYTFESPNPFGISINGRDLSTYYVAKYDEWKTKGDFTGTFPSWCKFFKVIVIGSGSAGSDWNNPIDDGCDCFPAWGYGVVNNNRTFSVRVGGPKGSTGWSGGQGEISGFGYDAPKIYADIPNGSTCYILKSTKKSYILNSQQRERENCNPPVFKEKDGAFGEIVNHQNVTAITNSWVNGKKGPGVRVLNQPLSNEPGCVRVYYFNDNPNGFLNKMNSAVVPPFAYSLHTVYSRQPQFAKFLQDDLDNIHGVNYGIGPQYPPGV